ncbi:MAG: hypothetical protein ACFFDW_06475 [Candidatus Thorarchaeota archaeon]
MPVELDFWVESLNKNQRKSNDISDYSTQSYHENRRSANFSIFETES